MFYQKLAASCLALLATSTIAVAEPTKLKLGWVFHADEISYKSGSVAFMKAISEDPQAKDVLEIIAFPNGALGRVPTDQPQLVEDGVMDLAHLAPAYSPGRFPDLEVLELPGLIRDLHEASAMFEVLIAAGRAKSLDKFFVVLAVGAPPHSIHTRFPVNTIADLKGRKIRSHGAIVTSTVRALGAVPVGLAISELAESIGRGNVDGLVTQITVIFDTKLDRVVHNDYKLHMGTFLVLNLMNKKKFESLPTAAQDLIRKHSGKSLAARYNAGVEKYFANLDAQVKADPKRKTVQPNAADQKIADEMFKGVHEEWAKRRPENAELLTFINAELVKYRAGK